MPNQICQNCRWCYQVQGTKNDTFAECYKWNAASGDGRTVTRLICLYNPPSLCLPYPLNVFPGNRPQTIAEATCGRWEPINE